MNPLARIVVTAGTMAIAAGSAAACRFTSRARPCKPLAVRRLGRGQLANQFQPMAEAMRADCYDGVISLESVYHPGNGNFEDGFRQCIGPFKDLVG